MKKLINLVRGLLSSQKTNFTYLGIFKQLKPFGFDMIKDVCQDCPPFVLNNETMFSVKSIGFIK